jgi:hypothetical protein
MANGEFENRESEELGDLSEDIGIERGELDEVNLRPSAGPQFPEMQSANAAKRGMRQTGLGSPVLDYSVRSIYDSRPVNSRDFNYWAKLDSDNLNHATPTLAALQRCFQTPRGYVTNIRKVMFMGPAMVFDPGILAFIRLLVDEAAVDPPTLQIGPSYPGTPGNIYPAGVAIPVPRSGSFDSFTLVDEGHWVGVQVTYNTVVTGALSNSQLFQTYIGFQGQFLLKTGVPPSFQAANEGKRARTAETVPARDAVGAGGMTPQVSMRRRRRLDPFAGVPNVNDPRLRKR